MVAVANDLAVVVEACRFVQFPSRLTGNQVAEAHPLAFVPEDGGSSGIEGRIGSLGSHHLSVVVNRVGVAIVAEIQALPVLPEGAVVLLNARKDRKSTRLNSSHR